MQRSRACPKCASKKLWVIQGFGVKDPSVMIGGAMPLRIVARRPGPAEGGFFGLGTQGHYDAGRTDAWICAGCGYTELWTASIEGLVHNPEAGVHLLEG